MNKSFVRELFVGHILVKEGDIVLGWGRRQEELLARGLSRSFLKRAVLQGLLEKVEAVPELKQGVPDYKAEPIVTYVYREPFAKPENVAD